MTIFVRNLLKVKNSVLLLLLCFASMNSVSFGQTAQEYYQEANRYREADDYEQAIEFYSLAIMQNRNFGDAYAERGYAYSRLRQYESALDNYNQAISIGEVQNIYLVYYNRGWAKYNLGEKAAACPDWQKALDLGYEKASKTLQDYCKTQK